MRDGNTTNEHVPTNYSRASGREELARDIRRCEFRSNISAGILEGEWQRISTVG